MVDSLCLDHRVLSMRGGTFPSFAEHSSARND
jgi:hypothetical protein